MSHFNEHKIPWKCCKDEPPCHPSFICSLCVPHLKTARFRICMRITCHAEKNPNKSGNKKGTKILGKNRKRNQITPAECCDKWRMCLVNASSRGDIVEQMKNKSPKLSENWNRFKVPQLTIKGEKWGKGMRIFLYIARYPCGNHMVHPRACWQRHQHT